MYPSLPGVEDQYVIKDIVRLTDKNLPITITARNINYEFYWEEKCKELVNVKVEQHGGSYKQAYIETHIQKLLENHKSDGSKEEIIKELDAARYDVFCLVIE